MSSTPLPLSLSPAGRRQAGYVLRAAAVLGLIIGVDTLLLHLRFDPLADVRAYYDAGSRLNAGIPLYDQPATTEEAAFYRYPPLLAIAFRPLALLPFEVAAAMWEALLLALLALTVVRLGVRDGRTWLLVAWLAAPIGWSVAIGQAHVAVTFLLAWGSPLAIATAAHLKLFPILAGVWWLGRRDWRSLGRLVAWVAVLAFVQFVLEPAGTIAYLTEPSLDDVGAIENRSLYALSPQLYAVSVLVLAFVAWRFAPTRAGWVLAIALTVFASPRLFVYQLMSFLAAKRPPNP